MRRDYVTEHGRYPEAYSVFMYMTQTGGGWKGEIGSLKAEMTLTGGLTVDDLAWEPGFLEDNPYMVYVRPVRSQWRKTGPSSMELVWKNFDPRTDEQKRYIFLVLRDRDEPWVVVLQWAVLGAAFCVAGAGAHWLRKRVRVSFSAQEN